MGTMHTISDKRVRRWPYMVDGIWKIDRIHKGRVRGIGSYPYTKKNEPIAEYETKYRIKFKAGEFESLREMSRPARRQWCLARCR